MGEIFQKYKNIGLEKHILNIKQISIPLIIVGQKNVGKKELIKNSLKSVIMCNDLSKVPDYCNGYFYNLLCIPNIDKLNQKSQNELCSYIDKFQSVVRFIFTARTTNVIDALKSRICFYKLLPPTDLEIQNNIGKIIINEQINTDITLFFGKTYHLILVELTLIIHKKSCDILYSEQIQCKEVIDNLKTLPYQEIRKIMYDLYLKQYCVLSPPRTSNELVHAFFS